MKKVKPWSLYRRITYAFIVSSILTLILLVLLAAWVMHEKQSLLHPMMLAVVFLGAI